MSFSIYNPEETNHRGRVIDKHLLTPQLQDIRQQVTLKVENETTNLKVGVQANALAVMSGDGESVESITLIDSGKDYKYPPLVTFQDNGHVATADAAITNGEVTSINITFGGKGYVNPKVNILGIDHTGEAVAEAVVAGGVITGVTIKQGGAGYLTIPTISFTDTNVAVATTVINSQGQIVEITLVDTGRKYNLQPQIVIASPSTAPTLKQRKTLFDKYFKSFIERMATPIDIMPAKFDEGQVTFPKVTHSMSTITNPLYTSHHRGEKKKRYPYYDKEIIAPEISHECFFSIHNTGKAPIQEHRYTHNLRVDRNDNPSYIVKKTNEIVQTKVDNIIKSGGVDAIIFAIPHNANGTITGFDIQNGGKYFTISTPDVDINRLEHDSGKAQATVSLDINGYITAFTITNPTTNTGYTQSTPPDVYILGIKTTTTVTIAGGRVTGISINSINNVISYGAPPTIIIRRTTGDTGKAKATVSTVDINGTITGFTISAAGTGYGPLYKPRVTVMGGRGQVNSDQKQLLLDDALSGAFKHLKVNWEEKPPSIKTSGYKIDKSSSLVENTRFSKSDIVTKTQRQEHLRQESVIERKAKESALARYNKAIELGTIADVPAIPAAPELPKIVITTLTGSGVIIEPYVSFEGKITGFNIINGGTGYPESPPTIIFTPAVGDGGFGAAARPIISSGVITDVEMVFGGYDYFADPTVQMTGGGGSGASFGVTRSSLTLKITDVTVGGGGNNYLSIDLTGGGGTGFKGLLVTEDGVITQVNIQQTGSGFNVQDPPNSIYLQYLADARSVVKTKEAPGPGETAPPTGKLPEPTLKDDALNMAIRKLNDQRLQARRAKSSVITVAIQSRSEARLTYEIWKLNPSAANKTAAQNAFTKATKATAAAYGYQKWLPPASDNSLKHKSDIFP